MQRLSEVDYEENNGESENVDDSDDEPQNDANDDDGVDEVDEDGRSVDSDVVMVRAEDAGEDFHPTTDDDEEDEEESVSVAVIRM